MECRLTMILAVFMHKSLRCITSETLVNLRNRTGEERRQQTLCDKHDHILFEKLSTKLHFPLNRSFCERPENVMLSEDHNKLAIIYRPVTFVTHKRFAVLFSLPSYCIIFSSWKYQYSPHRRDWKFLGGGGGSQRPKNLSKCMKLDWRVQRGGGSKKKSLPCMGEVWIIFGTTQSLYLSHQDALKIWDIEVNWSENGTQSR